MSDLISVIIPAYNHEIYIAECIDSFICQSYKNIELIVLNDGSPDRTAEIIRNKKAECESRFINFTFIDKENEGVIKTLNQGLSLARGEFVFICASDDKVSENAISDLHTALEKKEDYGLAVGNCLIIDSESQVCFWDKKKRNVPMGKKVEFSSFTDFLMKSHPDINFYGESFGSYSSLLSGNYIPNGYLIRKQLLDDIGGYQEGLPLEDYYLMLQLAKKTKFLCIKEDVFFYRWHDENTIKKPKGKLEIPVNLRYLSNEINIINRDNLEYLKPAINEYYARKIAKNLLNIPGLIKLDKIKCNGIVIYKITCLGLSWEFKTTWKI